MPKQSSSISLTVQDTPESQPVQTSTSPFVTTKAPISASTPTQQDISMQQILIRCDVSRQFPNPQIATFLGDKLASMYRRRKEKAEATLSIAQTIDQMDNIIWSAMGVIAGLVLGGIAAKGVVKGIAFLADKSTAVVDDWVNDLEEAIANGQMPPQDINKLALIAGEPELLLEIKRSVMQIPQSQLQSELYRLLESEKSLKRLIRSIPSFLFDGSPSLQLGAYFGLATIQITIKYVCDALLGIDSPYLPPSFNPIAPDSAPPSSNIPNFSKTEVKGNGEDNKSILPILIALGIGAYSLL